jgi:hypothetical protein
MMPRSVAGGKLGHDSREVACGSHRMRKGWSRGDMSLGRRVETAGQGL